MLIAIALGFKLLTAIIASSIARLRRKRLRSRYAYTMTVPSFHNVILIGSSWYVMLLLRSWPRDMRFESQSGAKATLCSSIVFPPDSSSAIVPTSLVRIIWLVAVTKSILLGWVLRKSSQLLQRWRDAHESRNQVLDIVFCKDFFVMYAFLTRPGTNGSKSESSSSSCSVAHYAQFCRLLRRPLCRKLFSFLFLFWLWNNELLVAVDFICLSGNGQLRPQWPAR